MVNNMTTTIQQSGNQMIALFSGRLDTAAAIPTAEAVKPLMEAENKEIILDCSQLEYISSSGLRLFLNVLKNAKPKGVHVYVTGMNASIRSVFTMTGFMNLFEIK